MATQTEIYQLYLAYFGRPPDFTGFNSFNNATVAQVQAAFSASAESRALLASSDTATQVNNIYQNLFGRNAEPDGLRFWVGEIAAGRVTLASAAFDILRGARNADSTTVANRIEVATAFVASYQASTASILGYVGDSAAAQARTFLRTVTDTAASKTAALAGVAAAVTATVAAGTSAGSSASGSTFTLTAGQDTRTGSSGNDTFDGASNITNAVTATLQSFDNLDGGAGRDTLVLAQGVLADTAFGAVRNIERVTTNSDVTLGSLAQAAGIDEVVTSRADGTAGQLTLAAGYTNDAVSFSGLSTIIETVNLNNQAAATNFRVTFTSAEVGNGSTNESGSVTGQDRGLAVRVQREDGSDVLTGGVARFEDEGIVFRSDTADTVFDVRDISGTARGNFTGGVVLGTAGVDTFNNTAGASLGIAQNANVYVNGGSGNDNITSGTGNDFLVGGAGDDTLSGGAGNDSFIGGAGNDAITAGTGNDSVDAGAGDDVVTVGDLSTADTLAGGDGNDAIATVDDAIVSTAATNVSGFEIIRFTQTDGAAGTQAADAIAGATTIQVAITGTAAGDDVTISNLSNTQTVSLRSATGTTNNDLTLTKLADTAADTATVVLGTGTAALTMGALTANSDETVTIRSGATSTTASVITDLSITAATRLNVTATGNALTIDVDGTGNNTNLATIDASTSTANVNIFGTTGLDRAATVTGGSGNDTLTGSANADSIVGGAGNDAIDGLAGNNTVDGGAGNDSLTGGAGNEVIGGGDGNDTIVGAAGNDNLSGGAGDDQFTINTFGDITASDTINGGDGNDTISTTGTTLNLNNDALSGVSNIENLSLAGGATTVTITDVGLGAFNNAIRIVSASGSDHVINASGVLSSVSRVTYVGSSGAETYTLGNGVDIVSLGAGNDTATVSTVAYLSSADTLGGGAGTADTLRFTEAVGAATTISAAQLSNVSGFEVLDIDSAGTAAGAGNYVVALTDTFLTNNNNVGAFTVSRSATGTADTGTLTVNGAAVTSTFNLTLLGGGGGDSLVGGAGADVIGGGLVADTLTGGAGNDDFQVSNDTGLDVITDFNFGAATGTTTVDQIQILDLYLGGSNGAQGTTGFQTGTDFATVVLSADGTTGVGSTTDVVVITGRSFASVAELDTVIEGLDSAAVTQDFFIVYQDGLGAVRIAIAEQNGGTDNGADFTVTDAFQLQGITVTGIASLVDVGDFIVV